MPSAVPTQANSIMTARRRVIRPAPGPATNCQTLVTSDGTTSNAAAWTGAITSPRASIATVGRPMPTTPLTQPASRNTSPTKTRAVCESMAVFLGRVGSAHCTGPAARASHEPLSRLANSGSSGSGRPRVA
ncbi:MAG: hypothetical protein CAPSK01_000420 [Candidatus Accumulibacter vicinus]|uniref:Uncharacterized protein n=1 Tax=Candidatus Accumulibacter vicinus TaxID=2954382 RepID=A0A084Y5M7_9PROT|nr:MAG: hypothetical protein CAPSK01_000420 [Candidatus Accumulibacter vicinus]